jgi:hypothetical protein
MTAGKHKLEYLSIKIKTREKVFFDDIYGNNI